MLGEERRRHRHYENVMNLHEQQYENQNEMRRRIQVIMNGNEFEPPFYLQTPDALIAWTGRLRRFLNEISSGNSPFWNALIDEGLHVHLLKLISHSYVNNSDAIDNDFSLSTFWSCEEDNEDDDNNGKFYPSYSTTILSSIIHNIPGNKLERIYSDLFIEHDGFRILALALKYGICSVRSGCSFILHSLIMRTLFVYDNRALDQGILDSLIYVTKLPPSTFADELRTHEGVESNEFI
jgi:hypothetical protein